MKSFLSKFFIPAFFLVLPSLLISVYSLTHPEFVQFSGIYKYVSIFDFILSLLLMLFFVYRYRKTAVTEGNFTFKKLFSHAYRIVVVWALIGFLGSVVVAYSFKEETKKMGELALQVQVQELINKKGAISAQEKQMFEQASKIISNPMASSFSYAIAILFSGIIHCLIASAVFKEKSV
jgi:heme/copper-type cytochrome/quinol oxidase subunit 2